MKAADIMVADATAAMTAIPPTINHSRVAVDQQVIENIECGSIFIS